MKLLQWKVMVNKDANPNHHLWEFFLFTFFSVGRGLLSHNLSRNKLVRLRITCIYFLVHWYWTVLGVLRKPDHFFLVIAKLISYLICDQQPSHKATLKITNSQMCSVARNWIYSIYSRSLPREAQQCWESIFSHLTPLINVWFLQVTRLVSVLKV